MLLTIIIFIIILGIIILIHELGHFIAGKLAGVKVEEFALGFPPKLISIKRGETKYSLNLIPFGGYVRLLGEDGKSHDPRSFSEQSKGKRFWIIISGVLGNFILAWVAIMLSFYLHAAPLVTNPENYGGKGYDTKIFIAQVMKDSPAEKSDLKFGDIILAADGTTFQNVNDFQEFTKKSIGQTINFQIKRGDAQIQKNIRLRSDPEKGALGVVVTEDSKIQYPWWKVPFISFIETGKTFGIIIKLFANLIKDLFVTGKVSADVAGPVGIYNLTGQAIALGFLFLLKFIALLNINIGILNLLPFPALDGGRLIFLGIEFLRRGKKISSKIENAIHSAGFVILIVLLILITYRDIIKLFK
jgi:regulator of sigma E protease